MTRKIIFEQSKPYHVLSRAVEKREIFGNKADCYRFIFQMYVANIGKPAFNIRRKDVIKAAQLILSGKELPPRLVIEEHSPLVNFLSFALVISHYHFYLIQNVKNGIPKYMQKLNGGFAKYFNFKHNRKGTLFESRYKVIPTQTNFQSDALVRYINVINALDVYQPRWRETGLRNTEDALGFLNKYQFSSFPDLFGKRNCKILSSKELLNKYLGGEIVKSKTCIRFVENYLEGKLASFRPLFLE